MPEPVVTKHKAMGLQYTRATPDNTWQHNNVAGVDLEVGTYNFGNGGNYAFFTITDNQGQQTVVQVNERSMKQIALQLLVESM